MPNNIGVEPEFLVPSHTTAIQAAVSAPDPVYFDFSATFGDPDIGSVTGKTATGTYSAAEVPDGFWGITPSLLGPFGVNPPDNVVGTASNPRGAARGRRRPAPGERRGRVPLPLHDRCLTSGSNGTCKTYRAYLCHGKPGYNAPAGLGTPDGVAAFTSESATAGAVTGFRDQEFRAGAGACRGRARSG